MRYDKYQLKHTTLNVPAFRCFTQVAGQCRIKDRKACDPMNPEILHDFSYVKCMSRPVFAEV